jgi:hypothetical protein
MSAKMRSLPKPPLDFGSTQYVTSATMYDTTTFTLSAPADDEIWLVATYAGANSYWYIPGASQDNSRAAEMLCQHHQGAAGWQSIALSLFRSVPGLTWSTTINMNTGSSTNLSMAAHRYKMLDGFKGISTLQFRASYTTSTYSITPVIPANPGPPGGMCIVVAGMDGGGNGPQSSAGIGWARSISGYVAIATCILPTGSVTTPPPVTFTSDRSDSWASIVVYIR